MAQPWGRRPIHATKPRQRRQRRLRSTRNLKRWPRLGRRRGIFAVRRRRNDDYLRLRLIVGSIAIVVQFDEVVAGNADRRIRVHGRGPSSLRNRRWRAMIEPANTTSAQYNPADGKEQFWMRNTTPPTAVASPTNRTWRGRVRKTMILVRSSRIRNVRSPEPWPPVHKINAINRDWTTGKDAAIADRIEVITPMMLSR
jgi:hypothetical protein